jgi:hypothetical protein
LITVLGPDRIHELPAALQAEVKENGLLFMPFRLQRGIFPEWYQLTYHTQAYVIDTFAQYFKILAYIPQGANRYQDLIVLERMS